MTENTELIEAIAAAAIDSDGRKKLTCTRAFELAETFSVEKRLIGRLCDDSKIRICSCQLGCFK